MADYISGNSGSKTPLVLGIVAVGIVVVLGLVAFGSGGAETDLSPGAALEPPAGLAAPAGVAEPDAAPVITQ